MKKTVLFLSALFFISTAYCAEENFSKYYESCMKNAISTLDILECAGAEYKLQDVRLNKAYKSLQQNLDTQRKNQLLEAQRLWIKFKESNCNFYYDLVGGSYARIKASYCMLVSIADRAKELENLASY